MNIVLWSEKNGGSGSELLGRALTRNESLGDGSLVTNFAQKESFNIRYGNDLQLTIKRSRYVCGDAVGKLIL